MQATRIAIHGASGRMGRALLREVLPREDSVVVAAIVGADSAALGCPLARLLGVADAPDLACGATLDRHARADVLVDFSLASAFDDALALAQSRGLAFVSGTTGLSSAQHDAIERAAATIPILWSANFSLGVAVLARLVEDAARLLADWECEISEAHHRAKRDAPSGTALALGRGIATARGVAFDEVARLARRGLADGPRARSEIGFAVTRAGDIVGEHGVLFASDGERLELSHRATDRAIFARGALAAARWLPNWPPGLYTLADILGDRAKA
jgi:4-hydroxy-tetrahydrodipicolinate reductase